MTAIGAGATVLGIVLLATSSEDDGAPEVAATASTEPGETEPGETAPSVPGGPEPSPTDVAPSPTPTATATGASVAGESPEEFFAQWQAAFAASDPAFLLERLHPVVLEAYGTQACTTYLDGLADTSPTVTVLGSEELASYALTVDGLDLAVDDPAQRVLLERVDGDGEPYETAATLARRADGLLTWFTDCGDPQ